MDLRGIDHFQVQETIWIAARKVSVAAYDFDFQTWFECNRPYEKPNVARTFLRLGAVEDYSKSYGDLLAIGIEPINSPNEHALASELPLWYPLLPDLSPRSVWFDSLPTASEIGDAVGFPAFIKGARQTNRHDSSMSIARNAHEFESIRNRWNKDPILGWQALVAREFVELRRVQGQAGKKVRPSFEFRTFWLNGNLVGAGRYWEGFAEYEWSQVEREEALAVGKETARRIKVPFLVVDLAQTAEGEWIVIECNDGQESGYLGVQPRQLWSDVINAA